MGVYFLDLKFMPAKLGLVVGYKGQRYEMVRMRPYIRTDGAESFVLTWVSACMDCGKPFEMTSGLRLRWPVRRCERHRRKGRY